MAWIQRRSHRRGVLCGDLEQRLKAERIQGLLQALPELRLSGFEIAAGGVTLTLTTAKGRALTKHDFELAVELAKVA